MMSAIMSIMNYFNIDKEMICRNCEHYIRYYMRLNHTFFSAPDGRCGHPRLKARKTDTPACERFSARKSNT